MDIIARTCPGCRMFVVYDLRKEEGGGDGGKSRRGWKSTKKAIQSKSEEATRASVSKRSIKNV